MLTSGNIFCFKEKRSQLRLVVFISCTMFFAKSLLKWDDTANHRTMPWKGETDPYLIWLSEVILQQTRVEQGLPYFLQFKTAYPTVHHLANAPINEVMRLWQGLGYYSRARNLHETAKHVSQQLEGVFPKTFTELKKLKGVGDYTAAAIASFAYGENVAVVDGNVIRVLSRYYGIDTPFDTTAGKKLFAKRALEAMGNTKSATYNQAIMDFGATVCTPQNADCGNCLLSNKCFAYQQGLVAELPVRSKRMAIKHRYFNYLIVRDSAHILLKQRTAKDIWKGLYEPILVESKEEFNKYTPYLLKSMIGRCKFQIVGISEDRKQLLTHRMIHSKFTTVMVNDVSKLNLDGATVVKLKDLNRFALPKTVGLYFTEIGLL